MVNSPLQHPTLSLDLPPNGYIKVLLPSNLDSEYDTREVLYPCSHNAHTRIGGASRKMGG